MFQFLQDHQHTVGYISQIFMYKMTSTIVVKSCILIYYTPYTRSEYDTYVYIVPCKINVNVSRYEAILLQAWAGR